MWQVYFKFLACNNLFCPHNNLWSRCYHLHFTDEKTERSKFLQLIPDKACFHNLYSVCRLKKCFRYHCVGVCPKWKLWTRHTNDGALGHGCSSAERFAGALALVAVWLTKFTHLRSVQDRESSALILSQNLLGSGAHDNVFLCDHGRKRDLWEFEGRQKGLQIIRGEGMSGHLCLKLLAAEISSFQKHWSYWHPLNRWVRVLPPYSQCQLAPTAPRSSLFRKLKGDTR